MLEDRSNDYDRNSVTSVNLTGWLNEAATADDLLDVSPGENISGDG